MNQVTGRRVSWVLIPASSHVQQRLKMTKCFLLGDKLAILKSFFFSLPNNLQLFKIGHDSRKHTQNCSGSLKHLKCN